MNEAAVYFARNHMDAGVAASALRAAHLHPRIALDNTMGLGAGITSNTGRRILFVPAEEEKRARELLDEPRLEEAEDNPVRRLVLIVGFITALLVAAPFLAKACYP